ncbi:MAG: MliC family protein [Burkholderiales bacterium]|jgi:membrane-bound inhibitor of C-type lysozyme|nr:MliC family protein [Burkholderiales bacterium]
MKRLAIVLAATLVAGCSWFRSGTDTGSAPPLPADAVVYQCDQGKRLVVRFPPGAKHVVVMLPDREFRLDQTASGSGIRYSNGRTTLHAKGEEAFLEEGATTTFANCKQVAK